MTTHERKEGAMAPDVAEVRRPGLLLVSAVLTQLMIVLDMTIVAIALPNIQRDIGLTADQSPWTVTAYTLAFGGLVLLGGRLNALIGLRRSYWIGLIGFAVFSMIAGWASSFAVLAGARAAQGAFGALLAPTVLALLNVTFTTPAARAKAFGAIGATGGLGAAFGLVVGGALTQSMSWRWCFYVNLFIAAAAILVGMRSLPRDEKRAAGDHLTDDIPGLMLGCASIFCLVYGLNEAQLHDWGARSTITWLLAGGLLAALFVAREATAHRPVLPLWILAHPARGVSYVVQLINGAAQMGAFVYLTFYFQNTRHYGPMTTGLLFLPMVLALILTAVIAGRLLVPRLDIIGLFPLGLAVQTAAFLLLTRISAEGSYASTSLPGMIVYGIGVGLVMPMTFNAGTRGVDENHSGLASAVLNAAQQVGSSFGVALLATYATHTATSYASTHAGETMTRAKELLMNARTTPDSAAGMAIIKQLQDGLASAAQIHAYQGGFRLVAICLGLAALAILLILGAARRAGPRRTTHDARTTHTGVTR